jgi:hypothetical protein
MLPYIIPVLAVYGILKTMRALKLSGDQALAIFLTLGAATASVALSLGARINLTPSSSAASCSSSPRTCWPA